jgi:NADPH:quinone reductase
MKAVRIHAVGGPERLEYEEVPIPAPGPGDALVDVATVGVNFIDIYLRTGLYRSALPFTLGQEAAGTVKAIGSAVTEVAVGDRVAWAGVPGAYAELARVPATALVRLPGNISFEKAAAVMLQGMTAHYLSHSTWPLKEGDTALIHAAAGGVGLLLVQMAKMRGARVIGTVSTQAKADLALEAGADAVIFYSRQEFEPEVKRLTAGAGVDVVYDAVGAATFIQSLNSLRPRGMLVSYGNSSGAVPPFEPLLLSQKGSLFMTRPRLNDYTATRLELLWRADDVLGWVASGKLRIHTASYPLSSAADAHRDLETRQTTGKLLLVP